MSSNEMNRRVQEAVKREREDCAKLCDRYERKFGRVPTKGLAGLLARLIREMRNL